LSRGSGVTVFHDHRSHMLGHIEEFQAVTKAFATSHQGFYLDLGRGVREAHFEDNSCAYRNGARYIGAKTAMAQVIGAPESRLAPLSLAEKHLEAHVDLMASPAPKLIGPRLGHRDLTLLAFS